MKDSTKFLGVIIDKYLNFNEHIQYIKGKISRGLGIIFKCRRLFTQSTLVTLYNSFLYPHLNYCISVWGNTFDSYLDPLVKLQKRAVRVIVGAKWSSHTDPIFRKLKILKFRQIYLFSIQQFVYKFRHRLLPSIFDEFFITNNSVHSHNTRSQNNFRPHVLPTNIAERTIRVMGVRTQNYFANKLNMECSYLSYKASLRKYLVNNEITNI